MNNHSTFWFSISSPVWFVLVFLATISCSRNDAINPSITKTSAPTILPTQSLSPTPTVVQGHYQKPGDYIQNINVNGVERWYLVHLPPSYQPGNLYPLVYDYHGRTATAFQQEALSQMSVKADKEGFVVIHPQASGNPPTWWGAIPEEIGDPDMDFVQMMTKEINQNISVDPKRVYVTGMSNGGSFVNRLGCSMANQIAAIAPVSGGHIHREKCQPTRPVPVIAFHGMLDTIIPYEGRDFGNNPSVHDWITDWASRNGCNPRPIIETPYPTVIQETWEGCNQDATVILYSFENAGHTWPGSEFGDKFGGATDLVNATDLIWAFFKDHPMP